ncbi:MAG: hypothetical protein HOP17_08080 [Acidobacteria bacterium]|nr:hypothetical protein [Acidobacteriota bacterium]
MKHLIAVALLIPSLCVGIFCQTEILTNQSVVEMARVGLSPDIIRRTIGRSQVKFDTSSAALVELKKSNVPDDIIAAMIDRQENGQPVTAPASGGFSDSDALKPPITSRPVVSKKEMITSAKTIALEKSSVQPSRQALEKELLKRSDFRETNLTITRYKDDADLYVEIGYVSLSWVTHRYVYRIFDRRTGTILAAGETTSWGSLAENLARHIGKSLKSVRDG